MCRRDGLVVRTKCCKCVKPGSIPAVVKKYFWASIIESKRKGLNRIKNIIISPRVLMV
jgi:hypothetical protein